MSTSLPNLPTSLMPPSAQIPKVQFPSKMRPLFVPKRYKVFHGGRGSAKSWSIARWLLLEGAKRKLLILCVREIQMSIRESVHRLLVNQIQDIGLEHVYQWTKDSIRGINGTEFIFSGIRNNVTKIKSMEGVDYCWVEEAEKISDYSWLVLIPTIRKTGSEIIVSFNPDEETDPTYQRFVVNPPPPEMASIVEVNFTDNPFFGGELEREKDYLYSVDPEAAQHVWGGQLRKGGHAVIFKDKVIIRAFEPKTIEEDADSTWQGPYFGQDWGFAADPAATVKVWLNYPRNEKPFIYIESESFAYGAENDDLPRVIARVPGIHGYTIRADNSRPETINHVRSHSDLIIEPVEKWKGSVEDGIAYLRSFGFIAIDPDCERMQQEAKLYRYKVDPVTNDVLPIIVDRHNHGWDAVRYALQHHIQERTNLGLWKRLAGYKTH